MPLSWAIGDLLDRDSGGIMDTSPNLTPVNLDRINYLFDKDIHDLPDEQRPDCHKNGTTYTAVYGRMHWDRAAQTITTGFGTPGQGRYIHPTRRRLITPHEAARIQGFPDWFDFGPPPISIKAEKFIEMDWRCCSSYPGIHCGTCGPCRQERSQKSGTAGRSVTRRKLKTLIGIPCRLCERHGDPNI